MTRRGSPSFDLPSRTPVRSAHARRQSPGGSRTRIEARPQSRADRSRSFCASKPGRSSPSPCSNSGRSWTYRRTPRLSARSSFDRIIAEARSITTIRRASSLSALSSTHKGDGLDRRFGESLAPRRALSPTFEPRCHLERLLQGHELGSRQIHAHHTHRRRTPS